MKFANTSSLGEPGINQPRRSRHKAIALHPIPFTDWDYSGYSRTEGERVRFNSPAACVGSSAGRARLASYGARSRPRQSTRRPTNIKPLILRNSPFLSFLDLLLFQHLQLQLRLNSTSTSISSTTTATSSSSLPLLDGNQYPISSLISCDIYIRDHLDHL